MENLEMRQLENKKILVVDDEPEIVRLLTDILRNAGFYQIYGAVNCRQALQITEEHSIGLFLLDVNLPDGDGFSLLTQLREYSTAPVIFLTARGEADDRLRGLGLGADDYLVKPFLPKELLLRVLAVLRRTYHTPEAPPIFMLGKRQVDFGTAQVRLGKTVVALTAKEYLLLKKLYENRNRIVTNDALCMAAWGDGYYGYENTLMVHIRRLRQKIEPEPSHPRYLVTVKGLGYKLLMGED